MVKEMIILAFDSCNNQCSAALADKSGILAFSEEQESSRQAERLLILIDELLSSHKLSYNHLDALAITIGPGSFTGIRIGISAAKGIHLATNLPIIPVTCFEALAFHYYNQQNNKNIMVALDARRGQIYVQNFNSILKPLNPPQIITYDQAINNCPEQEFILIGNGANFIADKLKSYDKKFIVDETLLLPNASHVGQAAIAKYSNQDFDHNIQPLYIREADAKKLFD